MGQQIVKQPDGKFAIWSSIVDNFVAKDMTETDIVVLQSIEAMEDIRLRVRSIIERLNSGEGFTPFSMSYEECLATIAQQEDEEVEREE